MYGHANVNVHDAGICVARMYDCVCVVLCVCRTTVIYIYKYTSIYAHTTITYRNGCVEPMLGVWPDIKAMYTYRMHMESNRGVYVFVCAHTHMRIKME